MLSVNSVGILFRVTARSSVNEIRHITENSHVR